jgi:hypothetical protein
MLSEIRTWYRCGHPVCFIRYKRVFYQDLKFSFPTAFPPTWTFLSCKTYIRLGLPQLSWNLPQTLTSLLGGRHSNYRYELMEHTLQRRRINRWNNTFWIVRRQCNLAKHGHKTARFKCKIWTKLNSMVWDRERTIPTERPPLVGEVIANLCG